MVTYTYADCLANSYKVNWKISDVIGDHQFDRSLRWLPSQLSGADEISCLSDEEKLKLTHVEMGAYAHIFAFVEEFIAPTMVHLAQDFEIEDRSAFDALTNFAAEEVKHQNLFREIRSMVDKTLGFPLTLITGQDEVAQVVRSKNIGAVILLTSAIEWFTQLHYVSAIKDDDTLDPFTKDIFKAHWQEESQHARMDHLEGVRVFGKMTDAEKDTAVDDLIDLVAAVDGLMQTQVGYDVENLARYLDRTFTDTEREEITSNLLRSKRYVFIESGVTHPNFLELFGEVTTPPQQEKVQAALGSLLGVPA